jgi:endo-1,4-beta-xylanase
MKQSFISRRRLLRDWASAATGAAAAHLLPITAQATPAPNSIGGTGAAHGILAGCAVNGLGLQRDAEFRQLLATQAGIVVPENEMKWRELRPTPDTFNYAAADRLMDFAAQNGILVRGHNLCWHRALPDWFATTVTRDNAAQFLTDHIRNVAGRYSGRIHSWDVVNEAVEVDDGRPDGLRKSPWLELLGPGYLDTAFHAARAADPRALLVYNDYGIEADDKKAGEKRDYVLYLVKSMKKRGTPIDAVGLQSHLWMNENLYDGLRHFIRDVHKLGLQTFVTEMDVDDSRIAGDFATRDRVVAEMYGSYLDLVLGEGVRTIVTWGITDRYSHMSVAHPRPDGSPARGLPFDENLMPVAAFDAMLHSFGRLPAVRGSGEARG